MAYLSLENITVRYKKLKALDNVSVSINKGEIFGLIGPNGSGKTTMLKVLTGIIKPLNGRILLEDKQINPQHTKFKKMIGYAPQEDSFFMKLTVKENLIYFAELYNVKGNKNEKIENIVKSIGLSEKINEKAENLSGGMKRRLNIGCALVHEPSILLLDEPTIELDPINRMSMWKLILKINKTGTTIIIATNIISEANNLCSRLVYMNKGKAAYIGETRKIINAMKQEGWYI